MALSLRSIEVHSTASNLASRPGPRVEHYAITLDAPHILRKWVPGDATYADGTYILGHVAGYAGRWVPVESDNRGENLADESATIYISKGSLRYLPDGTLTANRVLTIGTYTSDNPGVALLANGIRMTITRLDVEAYTYEIRCAALGNIVTLPASEAWFVDLHFHDAGWHLLRAGKMTP